MSFLLPWLPEAVDFAKNVACYPYLFLTTNGTMATPPKVDACMRAGLDSLKFSFNYADAGQFESIAQVKGKLFADIETNLRAARTIRDQVYRETGHRCGLYASYIEYDGEQGKRMARAIICSCPFMDCHSVTPISATLIRISARPLPDCWPIRWALPMMSGLSATRAASARPAGWNRPLSRD